MKHAKNNIYLKNDIDSIKKMLEELKLKDYLGKNKDIKEIYEQLKKIEKEIDR